MAADRDLHHARPTIVTEQPVGHHATSAHGEHVVGTMDTTDHQRTFDGFVRFLTWNVVAIIVVLIFMALAGA